MKTCLSKGFINTKQFAYAEMKVNIYGCDKCEYNIHDDIYALLHIQKNHTDEIPKLLLHNLCK